jgi:hypothetical protein
VQLPLQEVQALLPLVELLPLMVLRECTTLPHMSNPLLVLQVLLRLSSCVNT